MSEVEVAKKKPRKKSDLVFRGIVLLCICIFALYYSFLTYSVSTQTELSMEALFYSAEIVEAIEKYQEENGSPDLSGLDTPKGAVKAGFVKGSPLFERLDLNPDKHLKYFDIEDFYIEFVNDGKDGKYIVVSEAARGKQNGRSGEGPVAGFTELEPETMKMKFKFYPSNFNKFMHIEHKKKKEKSD